MVVKADKLAISSPIHSGFHERHRCKMRECADDRGESECWNLE